MNLCMDGGRTVSPKISHCELPRQRRGGGAMKGNHKAWPRGNLYLIWGGGGEARAVFIPCETVFQGGCGH